MKNNETQYYVLVALMIALVAVVTRFFVVPIGTGIFNFSDTAVYLSAFLLGPIPGLLAGGIGAALADISLGYGGFAPLTFFAHGLQGLVAGYIARQNTIQSRALGAVFGTVVMVSIYFLGEYYGEAQGWGGPVQAVTEWPFNLLQNVVGAVVAIPLADAVRRAYPPLMRWSSM